MNTQQWKVGETDKREGKKNSSRNLYKERNKEPCEGKERKWKMSTFRNVNLTRIQKSRNLLFKLL